MAERFIQCECERQHDGPSFSNIVHLVTRLCFPVSMDKLYASMSHLREHYCGIDIITK